MVGTSGISTTSISYLTTRNILIFNTSRAQRPSQAMSLQNQEFLYYHKKENCLKLHARQWQYNQRYNFLVTDLVIYLLNALIAICQSACETRLEKLRNKMHFLNRYTHYIPHEFYDTRILILVSHSGVLVSILKYAVLQTPNAASIILARSMPICSRGELGT